MDRSNVIIGILAVVIGIPSAFLAMRDLGWFEEQRPVVTVPSQAVGSSIGSASDPIPQGPVDVPDGPAGEPASYTELADWEAGLPDVTAIGGFAFCFTRDATTGFTARVQPDTTMGLVSGDEGQLWDVEVKGNRLLVHTRPTHRFSFSFQADDVARVAGTDGALTADRVTGP